MLTNKFLVLDNIEEMNQILDKKDTFADIVNTTYVSNEAKNTIDLVANGYVELTKSKPGDPIIWRYEEKPKTDFTDELHNSMNQVIDAMNERRNAYILDYDDFYGEGAYNEKYVMRSVFDYDINDLEADDDTDLISDVNNINVDSLYNETSLYNAGKPL